MRPWFLPLAEDIKGASNRNDFLDNLNVAIFVRT